jgi:cell division protein FtsQ
MMTGDGSPGAPQDRQDRQDRLDRQDRRDRLDGREPHPRARPPEAPRRGLFRRRGNRRITVSSPSLALWIAGRLRGAARRGLIVIKGLAMVAVLAGAAWGGERAVQHVIASPRFAVREVRVGATTHALHDDVLALAAVAPGDKLLSIDTDAVAARVASHPWVASARVRRELPSVLAIDVTERRAAAVALLGGMYLLDENGRPFKRATLEEADGLVLLTGLTREQYASWRAASEAAFREALAIAGRYLEAPAQGRARAGGPASPRPPLSEIHIDPRYGFSLFLLEGDSEIRLGRGDYDEKLSRLDQILTALGGSGDAAVRIIHLDGPSRDRVPIRLAEATPVPAPVRAAAPAGRAATTKNFGTR